MENNLKIIYNTHNGIKRLILNGLELEKIISFERDQCTFPDMQTRKFKMAFDNIEFVTEEEEKEMIRMTESCQFCKHQACETTQSPCTECSNNYKNKFEPIEIKGCEHCRKNEMHGGFTFCPYCGAKLSEVIR